MKYKLTDEHRARFGEWARRWIDNAFRTDRIDRAEVTPHVIGAYRAAGKDEPRVIFVRSPFALRFAGGIAAGLDYAMRQGHAGFTLDPGELRDAMREKTVTACVAEALDAAMLALGREPVRLEVNTEEGPRQAIYAGLGDMKALALAIWPEQWKYLLQCAADSYRQWDGGNQWSGWPAYLSFFRYVVELKLDYSAWHHYERLAELSGPRIVHEKFCIVSDRPTVLKLDAKEKPHSISGPFVRWEDGTAMWAHRGVKTWGSAVDAPDTVTRAAIAAERDDTVRRSVIDLIGMARYWRDAEPVESRDGTALFRDDLISALYNQESKSWVRVPHHCVEVADAMSAMLRGERD